VGAKSLFSRLKSPLVKGTRVGIHVTQPLGKSKELAQVRETIARKNEKLEKLRRQLVVKDRELAKLRADLGTSGAKAQVEGIRPENIIWIFGTAKTGSTWLGRLMGEPQGYYAWREPNVGDLFGSHYYEKSEGKYSTRKNKHWEHFWILAEGHRETWINSIRSFVLEGAKPGIKPLPDPVQFI
jgi:hypothetical protein